jgi:hypothetical protein
VDKDTTLAECERLWIEENDISGALAAVKLCVENGWPLPTWCKQPAMEGLKLLAKKGGRGRRSPEAQKAAGAKHQRHHNLVMGERHKGKTLEQAYEAVAKREPYTTRDTIEHSYKLVRRRRVKKQGN